MLTSFFGVRVCKYLAMVVHSSPMYVNTAREDGSRTRRMAPCTRVPSMFFFLGLDRRDQFILQQSTIVVAGIMRCAMEYSISESPRSIRVFRVITSQSNLIQNFALRSSRRTRQVAFPVSFSRILSIALVLFSLV